MQIYQIGKYLTDHCYLTLKAPPIIAADDNFKFCGFFTNNKNNKEGMILHENHSLFLSRIRKDIAKFVVCCSRDWRFTG